MGPKRERKSRKVGSGVEPGTSGTKSKVIATTLTEEKQYRASDGFWYIWVKVDGSLEDLSVWGWGQNPVSTQSGSFSI